MMNALSFILFLSVFLTTLPPLPSASAIRPRVALLNWTAHNTARRRPRLSDGYAHADSTTIIPQETPPVGIVIPDMPLLDPEIQEAITRDMDLKDQILLDCFKKGPYCHNFCCFDKYTGNELCQSHCGDDRRRPVVDVQ